MDNCKSEPMGGGGGGGERKGTDLGKTHDLSDSGESAFKRSIFTFTTVALKFLTKRTSISTN